MKVVNDEEPLKGALSEKIVKTYSGKELFEYLNLVYFLFGSKLFFFLTLNFSLSFFIDNSIAICDSKLHILCQDVLFVFNSGGTVPICTEFKILFLNWAHE